jgi:hypothetical protein
MEESYTGATLDDARPTDSNGDVLERDREGGRGREGEREREGKKEGRSLLYILIFCCF